MSSQILDDPFRNAWPWRGVRRRGRCTTPVHAKLAELIAALTYPWAGLAKPSRSYPNPILTYLPNSYAPLVHPCARSLAVTPVSVSGCGFGTSGGAVTAKVPFVWLS